MPGGLKLSALLATLSGMKSINASQNQLVARSLAALLVVLIAGCGRANTVYADPNSPAVGQQVDIDDGSKLPEGFADQSLNDAGVSVLNAGSADSSVQLSTTATAGSRAILGLTKFNELPLVDFGGIEMTLKNA
ncbi:MAG: hypothetical protein EOP05_13740, partial [Proteobacteria bacterium]